MDRIHLLIGIVAFLLTLNHSAWEHGFGKHGDAIRQDGDADGDTDADGADFLAWQRQYSEAEGVRFVLCVKKKIDRLKTLFGDPVAH